jgi:DNA-binding beta-propeller fold protein YncE
VGTLAAVALLAAALLAPGSALAFEPVSSFGSDGEGAGQLSAPGGVAVGPEGNFFVADTGNDRVDVFGSGGEFLHAFAKGVRPGGGALCDAGSGCQEGEGGDAAGALESPEGIAVSKSGAVYVAEEENDRVSVFSLGGAFMFAFGYHVTASGEDVCTAETGCQAGSNLRMPENSELFTQTGPEGALAEPTGVAIDPSGRVYVAEAKNNRVSVFDPLGEFLYTFGLEVEGKGAFGNVCTAECIEGNPFPGGGISRPTGIATMPGGLLAISESGSHRIDVYDDEGNFVRAFGHEVVSGGDVCAERFECLAGSGEGAGALADPAGLAVSPSGTITVGDVGLERVSQFKANGEFVRAFGAGVENGADVFQVCTALTGCQEGLQSTIAGATPLPFGVAEACAGSIFVSGSTSGVSRVERFGEAGSAAICPPPAKQQAPPSTVTVRLVPTNLFQLGRLKRDRRHGTATLLVSVPGSGELDLGGRGVHGVVLHPGAATTVELPVRLVGKYRRNLIDAGRRRVTAAIAFTPDGGTTRTEPRSLTLVRRPRPNRHR